MEAEGEEMTRKEFNLARERRKAGLTQVQLAELSGVPYRTVQNHEAKPPKTLEQYGWMYFFKNILK